MPILYVPPPPLIEIGLAVLMPATVIWLDSVRVLKSTPVWSVKVKALGVESTPGAAVVTVNTLDTPPMLRVAETAVELLAEDWRCTVTVSPLFTLPDPEV